MKRFRIPLAAGAALLALMAIETVARAQPVRPKATLTPVVEADGARAGRTFRLALRVSLPEGIHVQSNKPRDPILIPTVLTVDAPKGIVVTEIAYPEPSDFVQAGQSQPLAVYGHDFLVGVRLALGASVPPGEIVLPASLRYQACDAHTCFIPAREAFQWSLRVVGQGVETAALHRELFGRIRFARP